MIIARRPIGTTPANVRVAVAAALLVATACAPTVADGPTRAGAECDADPAQFAVGQGYSDALADEARRAAGADLVRRLTPGQMVTMEFRADRLNLETDGKGVVIAVRCG